jgi:hypothetical protein
MRVNIIAPCQAILYAAAQSLNAFNGSVFAARRAGSTQATSATTINIAATLPTTIGSMAPVS